MYDGLDDMLAFTNKCLLTSKNLLQRCLLITLGSMEVVAQFRNASIIHVGFVAPLCYLSGNTHNLRYCQWVKRSMGRVINLLHAALSEIQTDDSLMLDYEYVMSFFQPFCNDLPEFESYMRYFLEEKSVHAVGSKRGSDQVLSIDEAMVEICWPTKGRNHELLNSVVNWLLVLQLNG